MNPEGHTPCEEVMEDSFMVGLEGPITFSKGMWIAIGDGVGNCQVS